MTDDVTAYERRMYENYRGPNQHLYDWLIEQGASAEIAYRTAVNEDANVQHLGSAQSAIAQLTAQNARLRRMLQEMVDAYAWEVAPDDQVMAKAQALLGWLDAAD